jgi:hypothetical protein
MSAARTARIHTFRRLILGSLIAFPLAGWSAPAGAIPFLGGNEVTDFNFDDVPIGSPPPTTFPAVDPTPQHKVYGIDGFPDVGPLTGTVTVKDVGTMSHAAEMSTAQGGTGSLYMDTQFHTTGNKVSTAFDLAIEAMPTGLPQATATAPGGQGFIIQAFGNTPGGVDRVFRFVATPEGNFGLRNNTDGDIIVIGTYALGQTYHIQINSDFAAQTLDAYIDDVLVAGNFDFIAPGATDYEEYFIFQNGVDGMANTAAIDNIVTYDNIRAFKASEPVTLALFGAGLGGIVAGVAEKQKANDRILPLIFTQSRCRQAPRRRRRTKDK